MSRVIAFRSQKRDIDYIAAADVPNGLGTSLADIDEIHAHIAEGGKHYLNELHFLLFDCYCVLETTRSNLKRFCGFVFQKGDYQKKKIFLMRKMIADLRNYCIFFDLHHVGVKPILTKRLLDFLMKPSLHSTRKYQTRVWTTTNAEPGIDLIEIPTNIHISVLPPELLSRIFDYSDLGTRGRLAIVSREWRDTVYHPSLWKNSVAKWRLSQKNSTLVPSLLRRRVPKVDVYDTTKHHILRLDISNPLELVLFKNMSNDSLRMLLKPFMSSLESLGALLAHNTDPALLEVIRNIPNLKKLDLRHCHNISNEALQSYFDSKPALEDLLLHEFRNVSAESGLFPRIALPTLKNLNLTGCKISEVDVKMISNMAQLEKLVFNKSYFNFNQLGISNLVEGNSKIVTLELKSCKGLQDRHLSGLGIMSHLTNLNLSCSQITDACLDTLVVAKSNIVTLNLSGCKLVTDAGLKCLASLSKLREFNLSNCRLITSTGLFYLANDHSRITGLIVKCCELIYSNFLPLIKKGLFQLITIREQSRIVDHVYDFTLTFGGDEIWEISRFLAIVKAC